jgi:hypothetical protein
VPSPTTVSVGFMPTAMAGKNAVIIIMTNHFMTNPFKVIVAIDIKSSLDHHL